MSTRYAESHIRRLAVACEAADLGARTKVIAALTGLALTEVTRLFSTHCQPRGAEPKPDSWIFKAPLLCRIEAAIFANLFERLRVAGHGSSIAMVSAYRELAGTYQPMLHERRHLERGLGDDCLTFDRAFHLAADLRVPCPSDGALWLNVNPKYALTTCHSCHARSLHAYEEFDCPLCRFMPRLRFDARARHAVQVAEQHRMAFRAMPPPKVFAELLALRPAEPPDPFAASP
jgi:hypothetical protein